MKTKRKTKGAKPNRQRRFAEARGYLAKNHQLAEIMLIECAIRQNAVETCLIMARYQLIAERLDKLRAEIKSEEAR